MNVLLKIIADTSIVDLPLQYVENQDTSWFLCQLSLGEILTIIVAVAGLCVAINQYLSGKKETWFLQVIVLPQLELIKNFYLDLFPKLKLDKEHINELASETHMNNTIKMASLKNCRKQEINDFFDHIIALVRSYDITLSWQLNEVVMRLEDDYVNILDAYNNQKEVKERQVILNNEQELLQVLNSGLSRNRKRTIAKLSNHRNREEVSV